MPSTPQTTIPLATASPCIASAAVSALVPDAPARWDMMTAPAVAQTLPGTYLPRLDSVQMRAAVRKRSSSPMLARMRRHPSTSTTKREQHEQEREGEPGGAQLPLERLGRCAVPVGEECPDGERDDEDAKAHGEPGGPARTGHAAACSWNGTARFAASRSAIPSSAAGRERDAARPRARGRRAPHDAAAASSPPRRGCRTRVLAATSCSQRLRIGLGRAGETERGREVRVPEAAPEPAAIAAGIGQLERLRDPAAGILVALILALHPVHPGERNELQCPDTERMRHSMPAPVPRVPAGTR